MLEKLLFAEKHAVAIVIKDQDKVIDLFDRFEKSEKGAKLKEESQNESLVSNL